MTESGMPSSKFSNAVLRGVLRRRFDEAVIRKVTGLSAARLRKNATV